MQGKPLSDDARRIILLMAHISHQLSAEDISTWTGEQFSALSQHIELGHDTSADCPQVLTGKPVGKNSQAASADVLATHFPRVCHEYE